MSKHVDEICQHVADELDKCGIQCNRVQCALGLKGYSLEFESTKVYVCNWDWLSSVAHEFEYANPDFPNNLINFLHNGSS